MLATVSWNVITSGDPGTTSTVALVVLISSPMVPVVLGRVAATVTPPPTSNLAWKSEIDWLNKSP